MQDHHAIANLSVTAKECVVREDAVVANLHIMTRVTHRHPVVVVSHARWTIFTRRAMNSHAFAKGVAITNHRSAAVLRMRKLEVLRRKAERTAWIAHVSSAHRKWSLQVHATDQSAAATQTNPPAQHAVRTDFNIVGEFDVAMEDCSRVNIRHACDCSVSPRFVRSPSRHDHARFERTCVCH